MLVIDTTNDAHFDDDPPLDQSDSRKRATSGDDSASASHRGCLRPQDHTTRKIQPGSTRHFVLLPSTSPSTLPSPPQTPIHLGPNTPLRHVVLVYLPCRDARRPPCQLCPSSYRPVPGADPGDSGCRPRPQLRHYL